MHPAVSLRACCGLCCGGVHSAVAFLALALFLETHVHNVLAAVSQNVAPTGYVVSRQALPVLKLTLWMLTVASQLRQYRCPRSGPCSRRRSDLQFVHLTHGMLVARPGPDVYTNVFISSCSICMLARYRRLAAPGTCGRRTSGSE